MPAEYLQEAVQSTPTLARVAMAAAVHLTVGGVVVALKRSLVEDLAGVIRERPLNGVTTGAVLYLVFALLGVALGSLGELLAPLGPVSFVPVIGFGLVAVVVAAVGVFGSVVATVAVGTLVSGVGTEGTGWQGLFVGALALSTFAAVPLAGAAVRLTVLAFGVGAVVDQFGPTVTLGISWSGPSPDSGENVQRARLGPAAHSLATRQQVGTFGPAASVEEAGN